MQPEPSPTGDTAEPLFQTDDQLAKRIRAVALELRNIASRRRAVELACELEAVARVLDPGGKGVA